MLALGSHAYDVIGEDVKQLNDISFIGGHRVRLYRFKKNVHFKLPPSGVELNIVDVPAAAGPQLRRPQQR